MSVPQVQLDNTWLNEVDPSVHKLAKEFVFKLMTDDTTPGLHIEPMKNPRDKRVRTGRVNDFYRAILFKLTNATGSLYYVHRVLPHDEANTRAPKIQFTVNSVTGVPQFVALEDTQEPTVEQSATSQPERAPKRKLEEKLSLLATWGSTAESLVEKLGFARDVAALAMACETTDDIIELAARVSGLISDMLLSLGTGHPISEVRKEFGLEEAEEFIEELQAGAGASGLDLGSDEVIIKATERLLSKAQFTLVDGEEELERVISAGDFGAWRVFLHPSQRNYVEANYSGAARLSGGAGTGKTVVLLHRTARLHRENPAARIVLTTYNATLAASLQDNLHLLDPSLKYSALGESGITVKGVDSLAYNVLQHARREDLDKLSREFLGREYSAKVSSRHLDAWGAAVSSLADDIDPRIADVSFLQSEYENVILPAQIQTLDDYRRVRRPGRGIPLDRKRRDAVWNAIKTYQLAAYDALSYRERLALAGLYLQTAANAPLADHVLIDEAQDFSATHWAFLRALVKAGPNDVFIAEDGNQRIYAEKIVLSHHGIRIVGRSRRLSLNYRTTQQNLTYAIGVLEGADYTDLEGEPVESAEIISARFGPQPVVIKSQSAFEAVDRVAQVISEWAEQDSGQIQSTAILVAKESVADRISTKLAACGISSKIISRDNAPDPTVVQLMTMHRAKGMEFSRVVLFKQGALLEPAQEENDPLDTDRRDDLLRNRSLVYVAATRARDELVIVE